MGIYMGIYLGLGLNRVGNLGESLYMGGIFQIFRKTTPWGVNFPGTLA